ncbi:hypothetical protein OPV22_014549 [Ensete ventricosum]|uniref:Shugoshin C-terminal domain-containing protein n=1 Tax=Ensete ventricosum TaxID=4639 RepID=A0AAV8R3I2_ENSVE|nr:hypothetical protein OPV22_014549 [Ensete ventricosum]
MAEDAERMAALKRAFADVILNTAKESAARILASDRRVLQLQQSMSLAREESLDMLLRLKSIMDSKINELEKSNLSHVRKIQELEVQLGEAKGTIDFLRYELKRLNSELDQRMDIQAEFPDGKSTGHNATSEKYNCKENIHNSDSHLYSKRGAKSIPNSDCCFKGMTQDEPLNNLIAVDNYAGNPDLASIILSNKEPEPYRNGCTQRIHAFERNQVSGKEFSAQIHDQISDIKSETMMCENGNPERSHTKDFAMVKKPVCRRKRRVRCKKHIMKSTDMRHYRSLDSSHSKFSMLTNDHISSIKNETNMCENKKAARPWAKDFGIAEKIVRRKTQRQKRLRPAKCIAFHDMQHYGLLDINHSKVGENDKDKSAGNSQRASGEAPLKTLDSCSPQMSGENQETTKYQKTKLNKFSNHRSSGLLDGNRIMTRRSVLKLCNTCKDHTGGSHISGSGATFQENSLKESLVLGTSEVIDDAVSDDVKNGTLLQEIMLSKPDDKLAEDLGTSITKEGHDDCKDEPCKPCGPAAEDRCDKILKYTFQRKRKRVSLDSKVDFTSLEESMSKQTVEKDNAVLDPQKSSLLVESSRESRRLAQVARQLISLSERRWW